jgi:N-methylhydantoinase A
MTPITAPGAAGVDVGGTFTDAVLRSADGTPRMVKVPTTADDQSRGLAQAVAEVAVDEPVAAVAHGTTTATNAVLERAFGTPVCLVTEGFADLLTIARQDRPSLYDLRVTAPQPAIPRDRVVPVAERIGADGEVVRPLADDEVERVISEVRRLDADAVAIVLLFGWARPDHEHRLAAALRKAMPDLHITVSADLVGSFREYERASTCALNAAVGPLMSRYLRRLEDRCEGLGIDGATPGITVMTSGGGTSDIGRMIAEPVHTLLSGPAAGVVGAAVSAANAGFPDAVAFDMGGTSTDVCLIRDGRPIVDQGGQIDGLPIGTPTVGIHTVGAGGGSIAEIDVGGALQVGPHSAGARPGPACYGHGGTNPTVTDAHAVLGHLTDLAGGRLTPDVDAARAALDRLGAGAATGIIEVVRAQMARALQRVTTQAGVDPEGLALVAYGGAGPLHASALARMLGCAAAVLPPTPGVLSAVGLLLAPRRQEVSKTVMVDVDADLSAAREQLRTRSAAPAGEVRADPGEGVEWAADVRYVGQAHELRVPAADGVELRPAFEQAHVDAYGYLMPGTPIQIVTLHAVVSAPPLLGEPPSGWDLGPDGPVTHATADLGRGPADVAVVPRAGLQRGHTVEGPAIITQPDCTSLLLDGDLATVGDHLEIVIRDER